jgi:hypothetical protein
MKFNTNIPAKLKPFYISELQNSKLAFLSNDLEQSWKHLETAHIIAQPYPLEHTFVHWKMLKFGIKIKNTKEILGQIPRLIFGGVKSFVGKIPTGNTGGANVPPLRPMKIPDNLQRIITENT